MSSIAAAIIADAAGSAATASLNTFLQTRITGLEQRSEGWLLRDELSRTHGPFDWIVSTLPPAQADALLPEETEWKAALRQIEFSPCYALLLRGSNPLPLACDAAVVRNSPIAWISAEASRPGHAARHLYTVHSDNQWATEHVEDDPTQVASQLLQALQAVAPEFQLDGWEHDLHRWRYARCEQALQEGDFLISEKSRIACCGDWCRGNRVEDAFLSGHRLGMRLAKLLG
jgi:predicted NAD/FAD-dependent oxidoreductase